MESGIIRVTGKSTVKQFDLELNFAARLKAAGIGSINDLRNSLVILDFQHSFWFDLGVLLWLLPVLSRLRPQSNDIRFILPDPIDSKSRKLWGFLQRWRFFEVLRDCVDTLDAILLPKQLAQLREPFIYAHASARDEDGSVSYVHTARLLEINAIGLGTASSGPDAMVAEYLARFRDWPLKIALRQLCGWETDAADAFVRLVIDEAIRNSCLHATGTFAVIAMRVDGKFLTMAVADNGAGIPATLRSRYSHDIKKTNRDSALIKYFATPDFLLDDSRLIQFSTERGTSSSPEHRGVGLYYLKKHVARRGGELRVRSGRACVDFSGSAVARDDLLESTGTMIRVRVPRG
jgi:hypothetical protein